MATSQNPTDVARETLRLLTSRRISPTPENYQRIYDEIGGARPARPVEAVERISQILQETAAANPGVPALAAMARGAGERDWTKFGAALAGLATQRNDVRRQDWAPIVRELLRQIEMRQTGTSLGRKKEGLELLLINFGSDAQFPDRLQGLLRSWGENPEPSGAAIEVKSDAAPKAGVGTATGGGQVPGISAPGDSVKHIRDLLGQTLEQGVAVRLERFPDLAEEANALARQARDARGADAWARFTAQLKQFWYRLEMRAESDGELLSSLLGLLGLLVNNIGELVEDDTWVSGQLAVIRAVIDQPLTVERIRQAERSFKQVVYKQSLLKHSLREVKSTLKNLITVFVERLSEMTTTTAGYHDRIGGYADRLSRTDDLPALKTIVDDLMGDTRSMQVDILRRRDEILETRKQAEEAEERVRQLEAELEHVSEQVREDQLTGTLNRRGLDDAMQREVARAERRKSPLCVAVLDLDNFKKLNDTYGHQAGDSALVHLADIVKKTLRPTDIVARFGGEEFVILFSETGIDPAVDTMRRLQRELTKQFFLHDHERLLITFSAGVAVLKPGETQESILARADKAMYQAKLQGKNRVVAAED